MLWAFQVKFFLLGHIELTHWGRDKLADISQTTLSSAFSWKKMSGFRLKFHWSLFLRVQLMIFQHCFRYWLGADQATSHYLKQWWKVYWRIYASLGLNELNDIIWTMKKYSIFLIIKEILKQKHISQCCACWWTRTVGLTLWGWVTHICISKIIIIDSDNGLSLGRHQTIIWTNAGILLIGPLATNSGEISIRIQTFSFKKMHGKCLCEM